METGGRESLVVLMVSLVLSGPGVGQPQGQSIPPSTGGQRHKQVRISEAESRQLLMRMVQPIYPQTAKQRGIEGTVVLDATVSARARSSICGSSRGIASLPLRQRMPSGSGSTTPIPRTTPSNSKLA